MTSILDDAGLEPCQATRQLAEGFHGIEDGELFLEYRERAAFEFEDSRLQSASFDISGGLAVRAIVGDAIGCAHSPDISAPSLGRALADIRAVRMGYSGQISISPIRTNQKRYDHVNPIREIGVGSVVQILQRMDAYARGKDARVRQVAASLVLSWQNVEILRADGWHQRDIRPLVRLEVSVVVGDGGNVQSGAAGVGGRASLKTYVGADGWQNVVDEALRRAVTKLDAVAAPAGEMVVVLGPGSPGILLHEAVGHGLEGDFNRKHTSAFAGLLGQRIASPGVTVVDDGTLDEWRGSLTVDDEGTPGACNVLIEDGILVRYMQDRQNARLMGMQPTGNGRRQSYAHQIMPRMTNTYMRAGNRDPEEIVRSVKRGLYARHFSGGQVDITSGKFVFIASDAHLIEDGRITAPVKGAALIGNGPSCLTKVRAVGNDLRFGRGVDTCGKYRQWVPVGIGQPTLLIEGLTVGGTAA